MSLRKKCLFIDTSVFFTECFHFEQGRLEKVRELAEAGAVSLLLTDVTVREIESNIDEEAQGAAGALRKFSKAGRLLRSNLWPGLAPAFDGLEPSDISAVLKHQMQQFIQSTHAEIVTTDSVSVSEILQKYFDRAPPFSAKKKSEFPDAIVVAALEAWCDLNNETLHVVADDSDLRQACDGSTSLQHVRTLAEFLDLVFGEADTATLVHANFEGHLAAIKKKIEEMVADNWIYLEDEDGNVDDVSVTNVEISSPSIVALEESEAVIEMNLEIQIEGVAVFVDQDTVFYDKEEQKIMFCDHRAVKATWVLGTYGSVTARIDPEDTEAFEIVGVDIPDGDLGSVSMENAEILEEIHLDE